MAVPLNANALTTLAEALIVLGLTTDSGGPVDDKVTRMINSASDLFENRCDRKFVLTDEVESVPGFGTDKLRVSRWPVVTVAGITYDGATVDITDLFIDKPAGLLQLQGGFRNTAHFDGSAIGTPSLPGTELPLYAVTYQGGYITPQHDGDAASPFDGDDRNMPYDLEEAVLTLIRSRAGARTVVRDPTVKSQKLRTWAASYVTSGNSAGGSGSDLPSEVQDAIAQYGRLV